MNELTNYSEIIKNLKSTILSSRYRAAILVNQELLTLYFSVGKLISDKTKQEKWGTKVLERLSEELQNELPGLKGFGATNLKYMKIFHDAWSEFDILKISYISDNQKVIIRSSVTDEFRNTFLQVSFTHHYEILIKTSTLEERIFYIQKIAQNFWSVDTLKHHIKANLYQKEGSLPNNFAQIITDKDVRFKALHNYLFSPLPKSIRTMPTAIFAAIASL